MKDKIILIIEVMFDDESGMWIATSDDVPGLATEAPTFEKLKERVMAVTPELLQLNEVLPKKHDIPLQFIHAQELELHCG